MKTAHVIIGGLAVAGLGYWFYKKNQGVNVMQSIMPSNNKPATVVSDSTVQAANAPAYTIANDQVQVVKTTGPIPVLVDYTQKPMEPTPVQPVSPPPAQDYKPVPYVAPQMSPAISLPPPPVKAPCKYSTGQLLRSSDKVFQVDDNCTRHWVPGDVYARNHFKGSDIKQISASEMATTPEGGQLTGLAGYNNMMFQ